MKKVLIALGIVLIVLGVVFIFLGATFIYSYYHVLDASHEMLLRMQQRAVVCFTVGAIFVAVGAACLIIQSKM